MYSSRRRLAAITGVLSSSVLYACGTGPAVSPSAFPAQPPSTPDSVDVRLTEVADAWAAENPRKILDASERAGRPLAPHGLGPADSSAGDWTTLTWMMGYYATGTQLQVSRTVPCRGGPVVASRVKETDSIVVVAVLLGPPTEIPTPTPEGDAPGCTAAGNHLPLTLELSEPLGERVVVDASTGTGVFPSNRPLL